MTPVESKARTNNNLRRWREDAGWSVTQLAAKVNTSHATISRVETGQQQPRPKLLEDLCSVFHKEKAQFYSDPELDRLQAIEVIEDDEDEFDSTTEVRITVRDVRISAGGGSVNPEYPETREHLTFKRSWIRNKLHASPSDLLIFTVEGSSMEPHLYHGDKVVINRTQKTIRTGKVFAILEGGEARIKRLRLLPSGDLVIASDNPDKTRFPDDFVRREQIDDVRIVGEAVHRMGSGGL